MCWLAHKLRKNYEIIFRRKKQRQQKTSETTTRCCASQFVAFLRVLSSFISYKCAQFIIVCKCVHCVRNCARFFFRSQIFIVEIQKILKLIRLNNKIETNCNLKRNQRNQFICDTSCKQFILALYFLICCAFM